MSGTNHPPLFGYLLPSTSFVNSQIGPSPVGRTNRTASLIDAAPSICNNRGMSRARTILCLDLDAFYASVEEILHPGWRGKPILVGARPEERGVVASCSYAARVFRVHSAMPMGRALRLCPHALLAPPNFAIYSDYSARVMGIVQDYGCPMEQVSVDEVFLDATHSLLAWGDVLSLATDLKRRVREETGLPCTIGIASNKLMAKIASTRGKPDGLVKVPPGEEAAFLAPLPVSELWGIGPKHAARLKALGISTIGQLQAAPLDLLRPEFGRWADELQRQDHGLDTSPLLTEHIIKSVSHETTFAQDVGDVGRLRRTLLSLSEEAGHDLRAEGLHARTVAIKVRWPNFQTITRQTTLAKATDSTSDIYQAASSLLATVLKPSARVRLLGVRAANLVSGHQLGLFDRGRERHSRLDQAVDSIRERFGQEAIRRASLAHDLEP